MSQIATQETLGNAREATTVNELGEGLSTARGRFLDELPGAAFAAITLVWVVSSFAGLVWGNLPAELITHVRALSETIQGSHALNLISHATSAAGVSKKAYDLVVNRIPG